MTDTLRSYSAACRAVMPSVLHCTDQHANNRAEVSHQPTRQRERQLRRFTSAAQLQRFASVHGIVAESLPRRAPFAASRASPSAPHGLHDVTPCHGAGRCEARGWGWPYFQSANLWGRPVTLFACTFAPGAQAVGTISEFSRKMARPAGVEPATLDLEDRCSIQLSYGAPAGVRGAIYHWHRAWATVVEMMALLDGRMRREATVARGAGARDHDPCGPVQVADDVPVALRLALSGMVPWQFVGQMCLFY